MLLGALLDLGVNPRPVRESIRSVSRHLKGCKSVDLRLSEVRRGEFRAKRAEVKVEERYGTRTGRELLEAIREVSEENSFDRFHKRLAVNSLQTLVDAEARLHDENPKEVALEEAGSADTIADVVGIVSALRELGIGKESEVYSLPIAVGGGLFKFSHGIVQSPPPAVIAIASQYHLPITGGPVQAELATPTGVSILANLTTHSTRNYPSFTPERVGYGAGRRNFSEFPNVLRAMIGSQDLDRIQEEVTVLETNLDDVTGEVVGFLVERLFEEGASDVHAIPAVGKKSRPCQILRVISKPDHVEELAEILFEETGTLGVRIYNVMREVASREIRKVTILIEGRRLQVRVKVSTNARGRIINVKPEYEDVANLARRFHIPLRRLSEAVVLKAMEQLKSSRMQDMVNRHEQPRRRR